MISSVGGYLLVVDLSHHCQNKRRHKHDYIDIINHSACCMLSLSFRERLVRCGKVIGTVTYLDRHSRRWKLGVNP